MLKRTIYISTDLKVSVKNAQLKENEIELKVPQQLELF